MSENWFTTDGTQITIHDTIPQEAYAFIRAIAGLKADVIDITFQHADGGKLRAADNVRLALMADPRKKRATVSGEVVSAWILPLMACDEIFIAQNAFIVFHRASQKRTDIMHAIDLRADADELDEWSAHIATIVANRTGIDPFLARALVESEPILDASDALRLKIATKIIDPTDAPADWARDAYRSRHWKSGAAK